MSILSEIKAPRNIVIDTIPLILFLTGIYDKSLISEFKRIKSYNYTAKDFLILRDYLSYAKTITITPGVLTEVSNFTEELKNDGFSKMLKTNFVILKSMKEIYVPKEKILDSNQVFKLGFTDTSLILAAISNRGMILTRDHRLCNSCQAAGIKAQFLDRILEIGDYFNK